MTATTVAAIGVDSHLVSVVESKWCAVGHADDVNLLAARFGEVDGVDDARRRVEIETLVVESGAVFVAHSV